MLIIEEDIESVFHQHEIKTGFAGNIETAVILFLFSKRRIFDEVGLGRWVHRVEIVELSPGFR
jgi:hypothetical protein